MPSRFKARSSDDIYTRLVKRNRLIHCRCCSNDCDTAMMGFIEDFFARNSIDEAEGWYILFKQNPDLIFKANRIVRRVARENTLYVFDVLREIGKATMKSGFVGRKSSLVFHRHPKVHCKRFRCQGTNLSNDFSD